MQSSYPLEQDRLSYASAHTGKSDSGQGKLIAKYKQSIPTHFTYSPFILGYYHLSRFLDAGHVEPAIVRTMDVASHKPLADLGKAKATGSNNREQWTQLRLWMAPTVIPHSTRRMGSSFTASCKRTLLENKVILI